MPNCEPQKSAWKLGLEFNCDPQFRACCDGQLCQSFLNAFAQPGEELSLNTQSSLQLNQAEAILDRIENYSEEQVHEALVVVSRAYTVAANNILGESFEF